MRGDPVGDGVRVFNPRPRVRGDLERRAPRSAIAAPIDTFQSAPPREGRPCWDAARACASFNPRPRVRGDISGRRSVPRFNPRPRVRGDLAAAGGVTWYFLFQSAPPREGRQGERHRYFFNCSRFQSAPPREGRHPGIRKRIVFAKRCFNPRPRVRGDGAMESASFRASARTSGCSIGFQSAPRRDVGVHPVSIRAPA